MAILQSVVLRQFNRLFPEDSQVKSCGIRQGKIDNYLSQEGNGKLLLIKIYVCECFRLT